jgi:serine/threonine-protein kinase
VTDNDASLPPLFAERYRLLGSIGHGGMATVFRAEDTVLGRVVAIKVLQRQHGDDERLRERFRREARAAAKIDARNVVAIHDVGDADGRPYIVMEFVDGPTLDAVLKKTPVLPTARALGIARDIAAALAAAHAIGVIHRDVKPANVIIADDGRAKLADFGVAQAAFEAVDTTQQGVPIGSAMYAAPEQGLHTHVTPAADLYSLGIVLYTMLAGEPPFAPGTPVELGIRRLVGPAPSLRLAVPGAADEVVAVVDNLLAVDPELRPSEARVVVDALELLIAAAKVS